MEELLSPLKKYLSEDLGKKIAEDEHSKTFRREVLRDLGKLGYTGISTAEKYGGLGLGSSDMALALEEIGKVSCSYGVSVAVTGLPQFILEKYGNETQRQKYLPKLASGEWIGAFCLSETGSGSDAAAMKTRAEKKDHSYVLNGSKFWITHGGVADIYLVLARTSDHKTKGISAFIVEAETPGLSFGKLEQKIGWRASPTREVILNNVQIPLENRVGEEGIGFPVAMDCLDSGRINIAAVAVGLAQGALDAAVNYMKQREQFGKTLQEFQGLQFMVADMATAVEASRGLVQRAASLKDQQLEYRNIAAMAKLFATDTAMKVTTDAVQLHGGYGCTEEFPVERYMREAKVLQIVEGTNQVQRIVISRNIFNNT